MSKVISLFLLVFHVDSGFAFELAENEKIIFSNGRCSEGFEENDSFKPAVRIDVKFGRMKQFGLLVYKGLKIDVENHAYQEEADAVGYYNPLTRIGLIVSSNGTHAFLRSVFMSDDQEALGGSRFQYGTVKRGELKYIESTLIGPGIGIIDENFLISVVELN